MPTPRAGVRVLAAVLALGAVALVARPGAGRTVPTAASVGTASVGPRQAMPQGGVVVQVRDFPSSPIVWVVAWNAVEPAYGLGYVVRRTGAQERYHRLFVSVDWPGGRDVVEAQGFDRPLLVTTQTETKNCFNGVCTPSATFGARIPDGLLRASKQNVAVTFRSSSGSEIPFTLRRGLIDVFLGTVDSVQASLKKR